MIVEVCASSLQSAMAAQRAGADRIELCAELGVGGITPSYGMLQRVRDSVSLPVHVLIRPRSGHFTYSEAEFEIMCRDITQCAGMGFDGVVAGILLDDLSLDQKRLEKLLALRGGMHFTFHRAFDWLPDPMEALERLEALGVDAVLSSGQASTAVEGLPLLTAMQDAASHCTVMPGAGIGPDNAITFRDLGFRAIHLSAAGLENVLKTPPPMTLISPAYISDSATVLSRESVIRSVVESVK